MPVATSIARMELRREWRTLVPIVVLVSLVSGIALWSAAAARRTDSAFDRMLDDTAAWHVMVNPDAGASTALTTEMVTGLEQVADASRIEALIAFDPSHRTIEQLYDDPGVVFASDGGVGFRFARPVLAAGRMPDPAAVDEVFVDTEFAEVEGVEVGDTLELRIVRTADLPRMDPEASPEEVAATFDDLSFAPVRQLEVTGVGRLPDFVAVDDGFELPAAIATPALFEQLGSPRTLFGAWQVRLTDPGLVDEFRDAVDALLPEERMVYQTMSQVASKAERSTRPPAVAVAIFGGLVLLVGLLFGGQAVQRWLLGRRASDQVLRALGAGRGERWRVAAAQAVLAIGVGAGAGAVLAVVTSPLAPVGPARLVETDSGFHLDGVVLAVGAVVLLVLFGVVAGVPAWSAVRSDGTASPVRPARLARALDAAPIAVRTGVHFALAPSAGRNSGRIAVLGALSAVTIAATAIVFTASLGHLADTPRLYGMTWAANVNLIGEPPPGADADTVTEVVDLLAERAEVSAVSAVLASELPVDGRRLPVVAFTESATPLEPVIVAGRAPEQLSEVALGRTTMDRLGVEVGDGVAVTVDGEELSATVVGRAVLPAVGRYSGSDKTSLGEGAVVHPSALDAFADLSTVGLVLVPDTDLGALEDQLQGLLEPFGRVGVVPSGVPSEVHSLQALETVPRTLAIALVLMVAIPVVHSLLVAVRGRRRDLAVMSALGARPRTLRSIGMWQGVAVVGVALALGVPLGIVLGRWSWTVLVTAFGTIAEPTVALGALALLVVAIVVIGATLGAIPVWRTGRRGRLTSLRTE